MGDGENFHYQNLSSPKKAGLYGYLRVLTKPPFGVHSPLFILDHTVLFRKNTLATIKANGTLTESPGG